MTRKITPEQQYETASKILLALEAYKPDSILWSRVCFCIDRMKDEIADISLLLKKKS